MHHRRRKNPYIKPLIIGLAVLIVGGGEGLLYQQWKKPFAYHFDPTAFADVTEDQELVSGTLTVQIKCTNPIVVSEIDSAARNPETLERAGRPVTNGTFQTVMYKERATHLTVLDDAGTLCLTGEYRQAAGKVVITPQVTAANFNPFQGDIIAQSSSTTLQALPSYPAFQAYLSTSLTSNLLSQVIASPQYEVLYSQLLTEFTAAEPAPLATPES